MDATYTAPAVVDRYRTLVLLGGAALFVVSAVAAFLVGGLVQFFRTYLVGFYFCTGLAVGSLLWLMIQHMTGGAWGIAGRRLFEAATRTLPLMAVLFVPLALSLFIDAHGHYLYEWADPAKVRGDHALEHKSKYLNAPFFIARGFFYFLVWGAFAYFLNKWSAQQDETGDPRLKRRMGELSGPGILFTIITITFASFDWGMSLEPHWFSTIYGLITVAGWGLSALAMTITVAAFFSRHEPTSRVYNSLHFHDWGKFLLALVMLHAYFSFSQFLIIWAGNLPEEIPFYLRRLRGGWQYVGLAVVLFHFALPFALLLSRGLKRAPQSLRYVALLMLAMRIVDLIFLFAPSAHQEGGHGGDFHFGDVFGQFLPMFGMAVGMGGVWLWYFFTQLKKRPLVPVNAPGVAEALTPAAAHH